MTQETELLLKRIELLRAALSKMTSDKYHSMDPGSFECEAEDALEADDSLASQAGK